MFGLATTQAEKVNVDTVFDLFRVLADPATTTQRLVEMQKLLDELIGEQEALARKCVEFDEARTAADNLARDRDADIRAREKTLEDTRGLAAEVDRRRIEVDTAAQANMMLATRLKDREDEVVAREIAANVCDQKQEEWQGLLDARERKLVTQENDYKRRMALLKEAGA